MTSALTQALAAVALATVNLLIGLSMAVRYSPVKYWPHRHFNLFYAHRITAYATITLTLDSSAHPALRPSGAFPRRRYPPAHPLSSAAIAEYTWEPSLSISWSIVVVTSLYRLSIGRKWWKRTHLLVYPAAVLFFIHGVFTDSELKTGRADLLDGEKVFVEICFLVILVASLASIQIRRKRIINSTVTSISS